MKVKSLLDHINDYPVRDDRPFSFATREKPKGKEYFIADEREAQVLIDARIVEEVKKAKP